MEFSTLGALLGLVIAIVLIIKKVHPAYSLIIGALIGGIIGSGGDLAGTVDTMVSGAQSMMSSILRILTSGILAGALVKTGSAEKIADVIVEKLGEKMAIVSIAVSTMIICAVGVFIDISVITVAPIAMAIAIKADYNRPAVLLAMIGGGKAGNIISPNPNTIATAEAFELDLTSLMMVNIIPAIAALAVTIVLASMLVRKKGDRISESEVETKDKGNYPSLIAAVAGPAAVILLLALRPLAGITIDPLIALPIGGLVCMLATGSISHVVEYNEFGLSKVIGVSILLIGTGTIAGIIKASNLQYDMINIVEMANLPAFVLAPISGILMGGATASTTSGSTIASQTFASILLAEGVPALNAGAMIHTGATVIDSMPHGSFFHATGGSVNMEIKDRMKLIPYEALIGLTSTAVSIIVYLI